MEATPQSRIIEATPASTFVAMLAYIMPLSRFASKVDALVVFPGLGEWRRESDAIKEWNKENCTVKHLLIAGQNPNEKNSVIRNLENLQKEPFNLLRIGGVFSQGDAKNTPEQTKWVARIVAEGKIISLTLCVSPYHMLRAYLTLLKTFIKRGMNVIIIPSPTPLPPDYIVPETKKKQTDMVPGELKRITEYQEKGDVATMEELMKYLSWAYSQPLVQADLACRN
ncbi:MAG: hypothetical protein Q7R98_02170 [Candidatus Jorgensenbacteria bacterium]|nr:hypothetical protein [Candidatus Jorgensenbacteria bacterium]